MKRKLAFVVLGAGLLVMAACVKYPPSTDRLTQDLVVLTQYQVGNNFNQYKTFAISDSVGYITDSDTTFLNNSLTQAGIAAIVQNMENYGYTRVSRSANPDLGMNVTVFQTTHVNYYYPGWYWGYPGYYPPGYWGYPGGGYYYPYWPTYVTTYSSGSMVIEMFDLKNATANGNKLAIVWDAYIRALLTGNHTQSDVTNSINQAFLQTPQIKTSGK